MLKWKIFQNGAFAIGWLLLMSFLFLIPGSALPNEGWLYKLHPDKWVHIGLFAILIFLWKSAFNRKWNRYNTILLASASVYGVIVEIVQKQWVPNRSFDIYDVLADIAGSFLGLVVWLRVYKK